MSRVIARILLPTFALAISFYGASAVAAAPPPQIRYLDTDTAAAGSFVGIYGSGFGDPSSSTKVLVDTVAVTEVKLWTDTAIIFRVPTGAKTGVVKVSPASGQTLSSDAALKIISGDIYVVAPNGSDTDKGSEAQPFRTIHRALSAATAGSTVLVRGGTYDEKDSLAPTAPAFFVRSAQSGTVDAPITIRGFGTDVPVLSGSTTTASNDSILALGGSHLRLARLEINGSSNKGDAVAVMGSDIWLSAMDVHGFGARGIFVADASSTVTISGSQIHDGGSTSPNDHALFLTGQSLLVRDNLISNLPSGFGIMLAYQSESKAEIFANRISNAASGGIGFDRVAGGNQVYNNVLSNVGTSSINGCRCALQVSFGANSGENSTGDKIHHNTFYGPTESAVRISDRSGKVELNSNIFANFAAGVLVEDTVSTTVLTSSNNLWQANGATLKFRWDSTVSEFAAFQSSSKQEAASIVADPQFVNAKTWDFHLQGSSPAIDHGSSTVVVKTDIEGTARIGVGDMGAYEGLAVDGGVGDGGDANADVTPVDSSSDAADSQSDVTVDGAIDGSSDASSPAPPPASDDGGCGCTTTPTRTSPLALASMAMMGALALVRRRRQRR